MHGLARPPDAAFPGAGRSAAASFVMRTARVDVAYAERFATASLAAPCPRRDPLSALPGRRAVRGEPSSQ